MVGIKRLVNNNPKNKIISDHMVRDNGLYTINRLYSIMALIKALKTLKALKYKGFKGFL